MSSQDSIWLFQNRELHGRVPMLIGMSAPPLSEQITAPDSPTRGSLWARTST